MPSGPSIWWPSTWSGRTSAWRPRKRSNKETEVVKRRSLLQAAPLLALAPWTAARAQGFPDKPIRYIVPVAAGGGSDLVGRTVCDRWAKALATSFIVDNQSGGGGVVAAQQTMRAAA